MAEGTGDADPQRSRPTKWRDAIRVGAPAAVALAFSIAVLLSWRRLGSLLIDGGRELDVPRRLLEGELLYRDVRYYWGPLAPYLNAGLFRLLGTSADAVMVGGLAAAALGCTAVYLLARRVAPAAVATSCAIAFVFGCAFTQQEYVAIFNFVLPFNCNATYGMVAALWSVHLLLAHLETGRASALYGAALLLGLTALTKTEVLLAAGGPHLVFLAVSLRRLRPLHAAAYGLAAAIPTLVLGGLALAVGPHRLAESLGALANGASRAYIARTAGFDDIPASAAEIGLSALALAALMGASLAAAWATVRAPAARVGLVSATFLAGAAVAGVVMPVTLLRAAPVAMLAASAALVIARLRHGAGALGGRWASHLVLCGFGLASVPRIVLRVGLDHYGFFLIPPVLVCVAAGSASPLPGWARANGWARAAIAACGAGVLLGIAGSALHGSLAWFDSPRAPLATPRVQLLVDASGAEIPVVRALSRFPPGTSAVAIPQGVGLLFAAGLGGGADGMTSYLPMELPDAAAEERVLEAWRREAPGVVLVWQQDLRPDFGVEGFGIDYATRLRRWLDERYAVADQPVPGMWILTRRR